MLRSMTGFGNAAAVVDGVAYTVETRSVNNRYFRASVRLPESWSHAAGQIEQLLRDRLRRGSVELAVRMKITGEQAAYRVNTAALTKYMDQLKMLETDANPTLRIDLGALLQLPGVCEPPAMDEICERTREGLMNLIGQAIENLLAMRQQEGQAILGDLLARCDQVARQLAAAVSRAPQVVQEYHHRLSARVKELTDAARIRIDEPDLAREVAIYADRCDIAEEVSRLKSHLEQFRLIVSGPDASGRKLDFLAQEMLREANTIGSKSNDVEIARAVIEMKTAIDRIKEQIQNVE